MERWLNGLEQWSLLPTTQAHAWYACKTAGETFIHSYQNFKMKSSLFWIIPTYIFIDHLVFISSKNNAFFHIGKIIKKNLSV